MPRPEPPVRWAPRVRPDKIRRLYEVDALGMLDEYLLDDVGYALYSRCRSILEVTAAMHGRVRCARCEAVIARGDPPAEELRCPRCQWSASWAAYHATFRHQELYGGGAVDIFQQFVTGWEAAADPPGKMLLIDRLLHSWHWQTRDDHVLGRPTGVNLIEGSRRQVLAFLDELSYGDASTDGLADQKRQWRDAWERARREHRGE